VSLAVAFLLVVSIVAVLLRRRMPWVAVGWFWYLGTLVPVLGLVQVGEQSMADRFTYIPMVGLMTALVWSVFELTQRWRREVLITATVVLLCSCAALTWRQIGFWKDSVTIFQHTVDVTEGNYVACSILGDLYWGRGDRDKGLQLLQESLRINPFYEQTKYLLKPAQRTHEIELGNELVRQKQWDEALAHFKAAEEIMPGFPDAHNGLGVVLKVQGRLSEAATEFREVLRLAPDSFMARRNLGNTLEAEGRLDEAASEFEAAIKLKPDYFGAHCDLAEVSAKLGRRQDAITHLEEALKVRPDDLKVTQQLSELRKSGP